MKVQKALALAAAGGMLLVPPVVYHAGERAPTDARPSSHQLLPRLDSLPFSLGHVLDYFNEAFGKRPFKIDGRSFVYSDRDNPDEVAIVTVSDLRPNLGVILLATGDYGVNYMREFFEAPFFLRSESERLYMALDRGPGVHSVALERFSFRMRTSEVGRWLVLALEFSPTQHYRPPLSLVTRGRTGSIGEFQLLEKERQ